MLKNLSVLSKVTREDINFDPFPHVIIKDFYPKDIYNCFEDALPSDEVVMLKQKQILKEEDTAQIILRMDDILKGDIDSWSGMNLWRAFFKYHSSPKFWHELAVLFGPEIRKNFLYRHKISEETLSSLRENFIPTIDCQHFPFKAQYHSIDDFLGTNIEELDSDITTPIKYQIKYDNDTIATGISPGIAFDGRIAIQTPQKKVLSNDFLLPPHIDHLYAPVVVVIYFKSSNDLDSGGNLCFYESKNGIYDFDYGWKKDAKPIKTIEYDKNIAVAFVNSPRSIHGVTKKIKFNSTRRIVYLSPKFTGIDKTGGIRLNPPNSTPIWTKENYLGI